ncbi:MAG: hypothetical protein JO347_00310, partial [Candidatus Eremiobacteraeota bacterium]|nr:hypothetical protein [Candidatus Eremiobacteraeota bacterium]
ALGLGNDASKPNLLYVSSVQRSIPNVLIYTYPDARYKTKVGKAALTFPRGECADRKGYIFVTNGAPGASNSNVLEYAHGGTTTIERFNVDGSAEQCAVDARTAKLAVISSQLAIFRPGHRTPTYYGFPKGFERIACDYDNKGNLFVDGVTRQNPSRAALIELPAGDSAFHSIKLPPISVAAARGGVRWDGKNLAVSNGASTIYLLKISGAEAKSVGLAQFYGSAGLASFWISGGDIVGANSLSPTVMIWAYPAGGQPFAVLHGIGRGDGVAVSVAPK